MTAWEAGRWKEGLLAEEYLDRFPEAVTALPEGLRPGQLTSREEIVVGLDNAPKTLARLFSGPTSVLNCSRSPTQRSPFRVRPRAEPPRSSSSGPIGEFSLTSTGKPCISPDPRTSGVL
jgi:hypothetical protein